MPAPSRLAVGADIVIRKIMWLTMSGRLPLYLVAEYPKSGGTWVGEMLAEYLDVPFPRNRLPVLKPSIMHGHHLHRRTYRNVFCVFRDGRDVMVSAYFHCLFKNDRNHPGMVQRMRAAVPFDDYDDVRENLPRFIDHMFKSHDTRWPRFSWSRFVRSWIGTGAEIVKYEELLADTPGRLAAALRRVLDSEPDMDRVHAVAERYAFENVAKRRAGQENTRSFLRKGVAGDWKEKFTAEARQVFARHAGQELILAGYESDDGWVRERGLETSGASRMEA